MEVRIWMINHNGIHVYASWVVGLEEDDREILKRKESRGVVECGPGNRLWSIVFRVY